MLEKIAIFQLWFFISLLPFWLVYWRFDRAAAVFENATERLASLGTWRGGLKGGLGEIPKFAFLRMALGVCLLYRTLLIADYAYPEDWTEPAFVFWLLVPAVCSVSLIVGLFTQWSFIMLCVFQWQVGERALGSATLGNDVAAILSLLLFLTNAGSRASLDGILIKRFPTSRRRLLYFSITDRDVVAAKVLCLFCYWLVCVYSFSMHISEDAWMQGFAGPQLLTNNFMNRYHVEFVNLFQKLPEAIYFFIGGMWIMLPWYLFLLPFVLLGGFLRVFIIGWGILFFCLSAFVLTLGWLAEFEFIFWAALFLYRSGKVDLIYDDKCNLCDRTVNTVKRLDLLNTVRLKPISDNLDWAAGQNLTHEDVLRDLFGYDERRQKLVSGYDLYLLLTRSVIVLLPLWPIFYIGKLLRIGPAIYRFIADRRIKYFGMCMLPTPKPSWTLKSTMNVSAPRAIPVLTSHVLFLSVFYVAAIPAPFVGYDAFPNKLARLAHTYGIAPINVFNRTDLMMTEIWFVLEEADGTLVPVFTENGSRGEYHRSDRVYFGGTVRFRRWAIGQKGCLFQKDSVQKLVNNLGKLHTYKTGYDGEYVYRQYYQRIADADKILRMEYVPGDVEVVCEKAFVSAPSN
ncbi:thiol-disulfide oxidoreductase DCC family protein [Roseobacter sp. S98]|uniref:thiol-disulfide oxidoreductase DCC family protein n=1 Tax=Roseobacter algicola (ex Choi et al. 2025) (nom. illeg.) TaxID=3092138 RepID=UPI003F51A7A0